MWTGYCFKKEKSARSSTWLKPKVSIIMGLRDDNEMDKLKTRCWDLDESIKIFS